MNKIVFFHTERITYRGVDVAVFDYANFNELILKNKSYIIAPLRYDHDSSYVSRYKTRFNLLFYSDNENFQQILSHYNADYLYAIKSGHDDGLRAKKAINLVHAVFPGFQPHGDKFACISEWLSNTRPDLKVQPVPHIVNLPKAPGNFRKFFKIPPNATVYGAMGGATSFDVPFVARKIIRQAEKSDDKYFLFLGIKFKIINPLWKLRLLIQVAKGKIIFISPRINKELKVRFINTCDAMISARSLGESFGLAIAEFSILGKPIIVYSHHSVRDRAHIEQLGSGGNFYNDQKSFCNLLQKRIQDLNVSLHYDENYNPETVMKQFERVFLKD